MIDKNTIDKIRAHAKLFLNYYGLNRRLDLDEVVNSAVCVILEGKVAHDGNIMFAIQKGCRDWLVKPESNSDLTDWALDRGSKPVDNEIEFNDLLDNKVAKSVRPLLDLYLAGNSYTAIANSTNKSRYYVANVLDSALADLTEEYN